MKRIRTTTLALFLTLMLVVSSIAVIPASAAEVTTEESGAAITFEASGFGWPNNGYVTCYALSNGRVNTYSNAAATTYTGWIDGKADQCKIVGYNTSYMTFKVQYPTSKGTKTAWTKWSNFVYNTSAPKKSMTLTKAYKVYTKSDLSKQIGTAYKGDKISIVSTKGNLSQIVYPVGSNWKMGWAKLDNGSTNNNNTNTVTAKTYYVTASSGLILRKGAGTSYAKILTMPYAAAVSVTTISNGWAKASYNGKSGYCSSQYLSPNKPEPKPAPIVSPTTNYKGTQLVNYAKTQVGKKYGNYSGQNFHW